MDIWVVSMKMTSVSFDEGTVNKDSARSGSSRTTTEPLASELPFVDIETKGQLLQTLSGRCAVLAIEPGYLTLTFDVCAADVETAFSSAKVLCDTALMDAGLPPMRTVQAEVFDREIEDRTIVQLGGLMGVAEVAECLGVKKQRVSQMSKTRTFPAPCDELAMGPVWARSHVLAWREARRARPSKSNGPTPAGSWFQNESQN